MRLCIFAGSSSGRSPSYTAAASALGDELARRGIGVVYGGASVGLMGAVADAALAGGGEVIGVMPRSLYEREIGHRGLDALEVVGSMHERKSRMAELADGFIALPGGGGTLEEIFEVWTWAQLGDHRKPCAFYNVDAYYDGLIAFLDRTVAERFVKPVHRDMLIVERELGALLDAIATYRAPIVDKWIAPEET